MRAELYTLREQYSDTFFKIPKFQRSYAWEKEEWEDFWRTIGERALEVDTTDNRHSPVFMGAIVLQEIQSETIGSKVFKNCYIIDGQQRFVTISIFMAVLRDFYFGPATTLFDTWTKDFLRINVDRLGRETRIRLILQERDHEVYESIIKEKSKDEWKEVFDGSHSLNKLYRFFWTKLSQPLLTVLDDITAETEIDEQSELDEIQIEAPMPEPTNMGYLDRGTDRAWKSLGLFNPETLTNIIEQHMKFAVIEIQQEDNEISFEVFETLNAQGQPLAEVDKFRNGFFMLDPENSDSNYHTYWVPMENKVGDNELLSTFFNEETTRRFGLTPKEKTYQRLMTSIKSKATSQGVRVDKNAQRDVVVSEFKDLREALDAFLIVTKGTDVLASQANEGTEYSLHLDYLKKIVSGPATPILMDVIKWSKPNRIDREIVVALNEILASIEGLLTRRLLGGIKPQQLRSLLSGVPKKLNDEIRLIDPSKSCTVENLRHYNRLLNNMMISWGPERFPTDAALLANPLRDVYQTTGRKLALFSVLWELERSINPEKAISRIPSNFAKTLNAWSIEHVLPQGTKLNSQDTLSMNSKWKSDWVEWGVSDPEIAFMKSAHSIGNLTIVVNTTNSQLGNKVFSEKKEIYANQTRVFLTDDIKQKDSWTPTEIEERATKLIKLAIKKWPYPISS